jgi:hypothetical protein
MIGGKRCIAASPRNRRCVVGRGDKERGPGFGSGRRAVLFMAYLKKIKTAVSAIFSNFRVIPTPNRMPLALSP